MAKDVSTKVTRSMFFKLLPMQIFAVGILSLNSVLNSLIIGNMLGADHLSVFGYMIPLGSIHIMLGGGIASGSQILCGRYIGRGEKEKISGTYAAVSIMCIVIGLLLTIVYQLFSEPIATMLGASSGKALEYTSAYIRGQGWSIIFMLFSSSMIPFLQLNNASGVMYASIGVMTASNILLDLLSISVSDGMYGIGLASTAAYILADAVILLYCISKKCPMHFSLKDFAWKYVGKIFRLGLPNLTRPFCLAIRNAIITNVAVSQNPLSATALAIQSNMAVFADALGGGIDGSNNMIASIYYGERDKESLRDAAAFMLKIDGILQVSLYVVIFFVAEPFARLFGADDASIRFVTHAMRVIMLYLVTNFCMNSIYNFYKGIGKTTLVTIINFFNYLLIPVAAILLLPKNDNVDNVWFGWLFPEVICFIGLIIYSAIKRRKFPRKLKEIAYVPESFGIESSDRYDATIRTMNDISGVSENAINFCKGKGLDSKKSYYCGLCIEELAVSIIEHGKEHKKHTANCEIDLRMIYENDGISILLRDNYPHFDPMSWMKMHEPEDPMRYLGLRMVTKLAEDVNYSTALSLNVLSIRI